MKIVCPSCQFQMASSKAKTGVFWPSCKKCGTKFKLVVSQLSDGQLAAAATLMSEEQLQKVPKPPDGMESKNRASSAEEMTMAFAKHPTAAVSVSHTRADAELPASSEIQIGKNLGPYRVLKLLGRGGMGAVYLAKQTSLDRNVALKVIAPQLAKNAKVMARFTREAYAAAQLTHPNVVQVYDMGDDRGVCYFSMEWVPGSSLADLVSNDKKIDAQLAASYILHAARGLATAHSLGMVHRDIKPGNLLVDPSGMVKVADLGLVKVPDQEDIEDRDQMNSMAALSASTDLTQVGAALGTPYYMAPEQARDALSVDHRADIYSLGCTFYVLLTGKKPFDGKTFQEVVSKHSTQPLVIPSDVDQRIPGKLSGIVAKMMAKNPDDRYQSLDELIPDLERFLGIPNSSAFTPEEQDAELLRAKVTEFNQVKLASLRGILPGAAMAGCLLLGGLMVLISWRWSALFFMVIPSAGLAYFLWSGVKERGNLFSKCRELILSSGWLDWLKWGLAGLLLVAASFLVGLFWPVVLGGILGCGLGVAYYYIVDVPIHASRLDSLRQIEQLLRRMRLQGVEESAIQLFVAKYAGTHWEEVFEGLFGYPAKRRMRDELNKSEIGRGSPPYWAWRDRINDSLEQRLAGLKESQELKHLEKVEYASLQSQGLSNAEARQQATMLATAMVDQAAALRIQELEQRLAKLDPKVAAEQKRERVKQLLADARSGKYRKPKTFWDRMNPKLNRWAGSYLRFLLGCLLIVGSLQWARQNDLMEVFSAAASQTGAAFQTTIQESEDVNQGHDQIQQLAKQQVAEIAQSIDRPTEPLKIPILGRMFFTKFNALVAGVILVFSAIVFGWKMSLFAFPAAMITLWGSLLGVPDMFSIQTVDVLSALLGITIFVIGIVFGRNEP